MTAAIRSAGAVFGISVLVLAIAGCGRDVLPASHGLHGNTIRTRSYNHLAFTQGVTPSGSKSSSLTALALAPEPAAAPTETVDVPRAVRDVGRIPGELARLRRLLMYGALGVLVCGALNAVLLTSILCALLRLRPRQTAWLPETEALGVSTRHCRCGNAISERSRTGRCRRCALAHNRRLATAQTALQSLSAS